LRILHNYHQLYNFIINKLSRLRRLSKNLKGYFFSFSRPRNHQYTIANIITKSTIQIHAWLLEEIWSSGVVGLAVAVPDISFVEFSWVTVSIIDPIAVAVKAGTSVAGEERVVNAGSGVRVDCGLPVALVVKTGWGWLEGLFVKVGAIVTPATGVKLDGSWVNVNVSVGIGDFALVFVLVLVLGMPLLFLESQW
jgi:hypothetical protein